MDLILPAALFVGAEIACVAAAEVQSKRGRYPAALGWSLLGVALFAGLVLYVAALGAVLVQEP
jgi:hypothetical protein